MLSAIFFSTFITILIAELGDKTQLATLAISGSTNRPWAVLIGSSTALVTASLLGVLLGGTLLKIIPTSLIQMLASTGFLFIGIKLFFTPTSPES